MVGRTIKKWWPVFVLPTFAAFVIGFLWPFIWGIYLSFCKFTTVQDVTFVGFSNYGILYAEPDRWYCTWLYLADIAEWSAFQVGTATAFTFSKKWFYRYAHSAYVAADWIYDDHLHCRSEQCIT